MELLIADQRPVNDLIEELVLGGLELDEGLEDPQQEEGFEPSAGLLRRPRPRR
jgi:hypothetical protein